MKNTNNSRTQRRARQREYDKAMARLDREGCSRCRAKPYHGVAFLLETREVVCGSCLQRHDKQLGFVSLFGESPGKADDRAFFDAHTTAGYRVRPPYAGEIDEINASNFTLAVMMGSEFQESGGDTIISILLRPGVCARFAVPLAGVPPEHRDVRIASYVVDQRAALAASISLTEKMPAKERAIVAHASTALAMDQLLCDGQLLREMLEQGEAMIEARDATKQ